MALPDAVTITISIILNSGLGAFFTHPTDEMPDGDVAVYGEILPKRPLLHDVILNSPASALVIKSIPGGRDTDGGLRRPRLLLRTYAPDIYSARILSGVVEEVLHDQTFDYLDSSDVLHRIELEMVAGPNVGEELGTFFPFCDRVYSTAVM
jgi:hypothetical protein